MTRLIVIVATALVFASCASTEQGRGAQIAGVGGGMTVAGTGGMFSAGIMTALLMSDPVLGNATEAAPGLVAGAVAGGVVLAIGAGLLWYGGALIDGTEERAPSPEPSPEPVPAAPKSNPDATPW